MSDATDSATALGGAGNASLPPPPPPNRLRAPLLGLIGAVVVLAAGAVGYQKVVPTHHVLRSRLADLVVAQPGLPSFSPKPTNSGEQKAGNSGLKAVEAAAKASPTTSGVYFKEWRGKTTKDVAGAIVFLLPDVKQARTVFGEVVRQQLSAKTYSADGLVRRSTFTIVGVPGSTASQYESGKATASPVSVTASVVGHGTVVAVVEAITTKGARPDVEALTRNEFHHLVAVEPGFSLIKTSRPSLASTLWIAGTAVVALIVGLGPFTVSRIRARRRRRRQEELDRLIVVRGQTITKRRRPTGV